MSIASPALRRTGLGVAAGALAGSLVALQNLDGWVALRTAAIVCSPVPLVLATSRGGVVSAVAGFGVAAMVVSAAPPTPDVPGWAVILGYGAVVAYVSFVARYMGAVNLLVLGGVVLAAGLVLLHLLVSAQARDHTVAQEYRTILQEAETELLANPALGELEEEQRVQMLSRLPVVQRLLPVIAVGEYFTSVLVSTWISVLLLRRLRLADIPRLNFGAWRLPEWFVFCFLVPAAGLLYGLWQGHDTLVTVTGNALIGVLCVLFAHGCAILHAFLRRVKARPLMEALVFVSVLLLAPPLPLLLMVAGLFDFLVDFRGRWTPVSPAPGERPEG